MASTFTLHAISHKCLLFSESKRGAEHVMENAENAEMVASVLVSRGKFGKSLEASESTPSTNYA